MTTPKRGDVLAGLEGMTPGPWIEGRTKCGEQSWIGLSPGGIGTPGISGSRGTAYMLVSGICREADGKAIARVPVLIAEVKALRGALREIAEASCDYTAPETYVRAVRDRARSLLPATGDGR